jgi:hypothetical protein
LNIKYAVINPTTDYRKRLLHKMTTVNICVSSTNVANIFRVYKVTDSDKIASDLMQRDITEKKFIALQTITNEKVFRELIDALDKDPRFSKRQSSMTELGRNIYLYHGDGTLLKAIIVNLPESLKNISIYNPTREYLQEIYKIIP